MLPHVAHSKCLMVMPTSGLLPKAVLSIRFEVQITDARGGTATVGRWYPGTLQERVHRGGRPAHWGWMVGFEGEEPQLIREAVLMRSRMISAGEAAVVPAAVVPAGQGRGRGRNKRARPGTTTAVVRRSKRRTK